MVKNSRSEESVDESEGSEKQGVRLSVKAINNESPTIQSQTSELGQPTTQDAPLANLNANVQNATEISNELNKVLSLINSKGALSGHELLFELSKAFSLDKEKQNLKILSTTLCAMEVKDTN